jgi:hypothetical protein
MVSNLPISAWLPERFDRTAAMWSGPLPMNSLSLVVLFWLLLVVSCGYALWRGCKYERIAAWVFIGATLASFLTHSPLPRRYFGLETSDLIVDSAVLMAVVGIALVSDRFWPLWAAGLQLVDSMSHALKAIDANLLPTVYGAAERFWSYPILLILAIGTWRSARRRASRQAGESPA